MIGLVFKYLISACLTLTGNTYIFLEGVGGDLDKPKALHLMPPDRVRPVIDRRSWPYQILGYRMKLENREMAFKIIHSLSMNENQTCEQCGAELKVATGYAEIEIQAHTCCPNRGLKPCNMVGCPYHDKPKNSNQK